MPYKLSAKSMAPGKARNIILFLLFILLVLVLGYSLSFILGPGIDWTQTYRPAALSFLAGKSPYAVDIYFAAPWAVIPLIPFALLPVEIGRGMLFVVGLGVFAWIGYKLGAPPYALGAFLISPQVLHCLLNSNIEWLALAGILMPPWLALIFLLIKPQIGLAAAVYLAVLAFQRGGVREMIRLIAPVTVLTLISILLYGLWPANFSTTLSLAKDYNQSFFPYSVPLGLAVLWVAIRNKEIKLSAAASPMLSPYVLLHAWVGILFPFMKSNKLMLIAVVLMWILMLLRVLRPLLG